MLYSKMLLLLLIAVGISSAAATPALQKFSKHQNQVMVAGLIRDKTVWGHSPEQCADLCVQTSGCVGFNQRMRDGWCSVASRNINTNPDDMFDLKGVDHYAKEPVLDQPDEIIVEVAAKPNAQAISAHCSIDFAANAKGAEKSFADVGSKFGNGQNVSFSGVALGEGDITKLRLKCGSLEGDALQVVKLYVKVGNKLYAGNVNVVFDDQKTCNVKDVAGIDECVEEVDVDLA